MGESCPTGHFDRTAAFTACFDVDIEHPLISLYPGHLCPPLHGSTRVAVRANTQRNDHFRCIVRRIGKSEADGCSITVDFGEKRFYSIDVLELGEVSLMTLTNGNRLLSVACGGLFVALASISIADRADAAVVITNDPTTFSFLEKPTGKPDEPSLGGFEYLISSRTNEFRANDQYLIVGEEPNDATAIVADLGAVGDLSGTAFDFSIQHNLVGGRNFTFSMINPTGEISELCWGDNCPQGSTSTPILNGQPPINNYNGLQIQVRAQEVLGSSATVENLTLSGLDITSGSDPLFDGTVNPFTPGTLPLDFGRVGQWILGDSLDLVLMAWELTGTVTLSRPDDAISDLTKVRFAVDFVNDTRLATIPVPAAVWLFGSGLLGLIGIARIKKAA